MIHYSPREQSNEAEDHYISLLDSTTSIPRLNVLMIKARVGTNDTFQYTYHRRRSNNQ